MPEEINVVHQYEQFNDVDEKQVKYSCSNNCVTCVTVILILILLSACIATLITNQIVSKQKVDRYKKTLLKHENTHSARCIYFTSLNTMMVYWIPKNLSNTMDFELFEFKNSISNSKNSVMKGYTQLGVFNSNYSEQLSFGWNASSPFEVQHLNIYLNTTTLEPYSFSIVNKESHKYPTIRPDATIAFYLLYRVLSGSILININESVNLLVIENSMNNYQIITNLSLLDTHKCHNIHSSVDSEIGVLQKTVERNATWAIILLLLFLIVPYILYRKQQPSRSRWPILVINSSFLLVLYTGVMIITIFSNSFDIYGKDKSIVKGFYEVSYHFMEMIAPVCALIYCCHIYRYYYLNYLYGTISKHIDPKSKRMTIYRYMLSNTYLYLLFIIILMFSTATVVSLKIPSYIQYLRGSVELSLSLDLGIHILKGIVYLFTTFITVTCFVVESITKIPQIIRKGRNSLNWYFYFNDPLYFRTEMLSILIFSPIVNAEIALMIADYTIVHRHQYFSNTYIRFGWYKETILVICKMTSVFLFCGGITVLIQILKGFTPKPIVTQNIVEDFLQEDRGYEMMKRFCTNEWSLENLFAWEYLNEMKSAEKCDIEKVKTLHTDFLTNGSNMELNIPNTTKKSIIEVLGVHGEHIIDPIPFSVPFQQLYNEIVKNLSDSYARLASSSEYKQYQDAKTLLSQQYSL
jgi:hypothetical protein